VNLQTLDHLLLLLLACQSLFLFPNKFVSFCAELCTSPFLCFGLFVDTLCNLSLKHIETYRQGIPFACCRTWELTALWTGVQIKVPVKFIVGELDITYSIPGVQDYIHKGGFKKDVPFLQEVVVMEGAAHFINQEKAEEISEHIYDFIKKF